MRLIAIAPVFVATATLLAGCSEKVTHRERIPFSKGVAELVVTSVGGALGDERYELTFNNAGKTQTFFRGANFSEFKAAERGGKFMIHLCNGWIDHAEPIGIGEGEQFQVIRLNLDWNCSDKRQEA